MPEQILGRLVYNVWSLTLNSQSCFKHLRAKDFSRSFIFLPGQKRKPVKTEKKDSLGIEAYTQQYFSTNLV